MKKYIIAICVVLVGIIACTAFLITDAKPRAPDSTEYTVYVYPD